MPLGTKTIKVSGVTYEIALLPAEDGLELSTQLFGYLGGALGAFLGTDGAADPKVMAAAMSELGQHVASKSFRDLMLRILEGLRANDRIILDGRNRALFNEHFGANYGALVQVFLFALKENFGSFFDVPGLAGLVQKVRMPGSAVTSTGPSGQTSG